MKRPVPVPPVRAAILVVCEKNICRSPYATLILGDLMGRDDVDVFSRGTDALRGSSMCRFGAERHGTAAGVHKATSLARVDLERADLVLTATARERSRIAILDPSARARTFTLREAADLIRFGVGPGPSDPKDLAGAMNSWRGRIVVPQPRRWRRRAHDPSVWDVRDVHGSGARGHNGMFAEVEAAATAIAEAVGQRGDPTTVAATAS